MKAAVLSMDIEDWWHLDYIDRSRANREYSMLDGIDVYRQVLDRFGIRSTFFVLGELIKPLKHHLTELHSAGHEIGGHGWNHQRPMTMTPDRFKADAARTKEVLEAALATPAFGYRAPCYSLDRERLALIRDVGYRYDSSRIDFSEHPLYGTIDMSGFDEVAANIFRQEDFFEFQVSTLNVGRKQLPVSGGGYLRIFPWRLMRHWIRRYLHSQQMYVLYIHPFELSRQSTPKFPTGTKWRHKLRFRIGRSQVRRRLELLIEVLRANGYEFLTFEGLRQRICGAFGSSNPNQFPSNSFGNAA